MANIPFYVTPGGCLRKLRKSFRKSNIFRMLYKGVFKITGNKMGRKGLTARLTVSDKIKTEFAKKKK